MSAKKHISRIHKELLQVDNKKSNNPMKERAQDLHRYFSPEDTQMVNKHMQLWPLVYVIEYFQCKYV